jgi:hypothetical protein
MYEDYIPTSLVKVLLKDATSPIPRVQVTKSDHTTTPHAFHYEVNKNIYIH